MLDVLFFTSHPGKSRYFDKAVIYLKKYEINCKNIYQKEIFKNQSIFELNWIFRNFPFKGIILIYFFKLNERKSSGLLSYLFKLSLIWFYFPYYCFLFISYRTILLEFPSKYVGLWNGYKLRMSLFALAAKNLNRKILYFEGGFIPQTTRLDSCDVVICANLPRNRDFYKLKNWHTYSNLVNLQISPREKIPNYKETKNFFIDVNVLPDKYFLAPFQKEDDANLIVHSEYVKSMNTFCFWLNHALKELPLTTWIVVKRHPSEKKSFNFLQRKYKHSRIIFSELDTDFLIANSYGVITINSTVGMEALLLEKPVYVLGNAPYCVDGLVIKCEHPNMLAKKIIDNEYEIDTELLNNFLGYLIKDYLIPDHYSQPSDKHWIFLSEKIKKDSL